ncbi:hypothetical protein MVEG_10682 [Podila verticillata NRRL 6337]|nr:hypothetical protein MVEG_10682 [Podila verticillata NRRL 6337]
MPSISHIPHQPTLAFYRTALRAIRVSSLPPQLSHLHRKLQYNIRDAISIYRDERDSVTLESLIQDGTKDLAIIQTWKYVDPLWLERIFKKPTAKKEAVS